MTETHDHCQCDFCSGVDCGADDPETESLSDAFRRMDRKLKERGENGVVP